jgi:diacylglycerol O-acyltransferase
MVTPIDPQSVAFLLAESRNTPVHVGGLMLLEKPEGAGPGYVREMYESQLKVDAVAPLFLKRPHRSLATALQWTWTEDEQFDIEHHVRHSALPQPGRIRELLDLTSRLHGQQLSLERPLWEAHLIEGLADGRIGMYTKIHHALVDGVSAMRILGGAFSSDPDERDMLPPFAVRPKTRDDANRALMRAAADVPVSAVRTALGVMADAAGMPGALIRTLQTGVRNDTASPVSYAAPRSILNQRISGARRFAAQAWDIERIQRVSKATGTTMNDVVLAMSGGALRTYLSDLGALPDASMVSMVPVGLNAKNAHVASDKGGNSVGTLMVKLGTDLDDPAARLQGIHDSMVAGKAAMETMTKTQIIAMAALGAAPLVLHPALRLNGIARPPFNLVISNVPGPREPVYFNGAKLDGMYPASVPMHGQAMNITCTSYNGQMGFGLTGCRRSVPSLQRMLGHLETALADLEVAAAVN